MAWSNLIDMELDDEEQLDAIMPMPTNRPRYPFGLRICLGPPELKKLGLDADCSVGDMIDLRAFASVTCVHSEAGSARVELQIEKIALENEMREDDDR